MKKFIKFSIVLLTLTITNLASAATYTNAKASRIDFRSGWGGGGFFLFLEQGTFSGAETCPHTTKERAIYWIPQSSTSYESLLSLSLSAKMTNNLLVIYGNNTCYSGYEGIEVFQLR